MADKQSRPPAGAVSTSPPSRPPAAAVAPPAAARAPDAKGKTKKDEPRDSPREIAETVVFVIVLVLMLKTFVAEAFVIPTGSMAETLYGYQRMVTCDECGYKFPVNCTIEVDPQHGQERRTIAGCFCPNCQNPIRWNPDTAPAWSSGDRVLVAKFLYDRDLLGSPRRHQVIVFKYPKEPQQGTTAMNYIKRCVGLPGETIAIFDGDLYVTSSLTYPDHQPSEDPFDRWRPDNMYRSDEEAMSFFVESVKRRSEGKSADGDFQIVRKTPEVMLAMRRIVFDNDHQPRDLTADGIRRWQFAEGGPWAGNSTPAPTTFSHAAREAREDFDWITYAHLLGEARRQARLQASHDRIDERMSEELQRSELQNVTRELSSEGGRRLITNMMGYNTGEGDGNQDPTGRFWVSDLMLDFEVKVESADGELALELSKGIDRFRVVFNVASGECVLYRLSGKTAAQRAKNTIELQRGATTLKGKGTYHVRVANFDERLTVWVDGKLPFGEGVVYPPARERGPIEDNDLLAPARVGARGAAVSVSHLQLWRDTFYTEMDRNAPRRDVLGQAHQVQTYYVQPGHYLCLGDNSGSSADSREWGLVPNRLVLGRALWVYFPFWPFNNRFGAIR